jgi:glycosyltransferase involved in cell wall biosynthesis
LAPNGEKLFIFAGRLVRWKGAQYLIEALALLKAQGWAVKVLIAGEGSYRADLEALAQRLSVSEAVVFLGNLPNRELPAYYAISTAIVGTSFANETFGIALCEAAACEKPIIASAFGGFKEVVRDGETGLLYEPQNVSDLAAKMLVVLENPEQAIQMGRAGRNFVLENFTWPQVATRVYTKIKELKN